MNARNGRFVWFDLLTSNINAAKAFYTDLVGWKMIPWHQGEYQMWGVGETPVGGVMQLPAEAAKAGQPPHWLGYIATEDVDATAKRAQTLGGKVQVPGTDIPEVGRYAILADPQGAVFGVFQSNQPDAGLDRSVLGTFSWAELHTTDWEAAWRFYSELLGWKKTESMNMGPDGEYFMFGTDGTSMGALFNGAKMRKVPPHWLHYTNVASVDEAAARMPQMGGKVLNGPMEVPGGDRIVQAMDPQGAVFALFSSPKR